VIDIRIEAVRDLIAFQSVKMVTVPEYDEVGKQPFVIVYLYMGDTIGADTYRWGDSDWLTVWDGKRWTSVEDANAFDPYDDTKNKDILAVFKKDN